MEINLSRDSIVSQRTGAVETPSEYLDNLRAVEANIAHADDDIAALKASLKHARDQREDLVAQLRAAVREGKVLPLLEAVTTDDDGLNLDGE